ncbi:hypothetical protein DE146DRAFT_779687 [Phaeosphaeria sp. MPI-PUGE-AT-0046c]|nr:hypothetical protein DE146DRAFT_779687 [Phaeosphaeria sp. MPI-PUGE-AT-0046c]
MRHIFGYVLAASAILRPLGAKVIATSLPSKDIHGSDNLLSGDSLVASDFDHMGLWSLFARKDMFDRVHASGFDGTSLSQRSNLRNSALVYHKRAPVPPEPANPVPIDWKYLGCFIDAGSIHEAKDKGFYWSAEEAVKFPVPAMMSATICTASCSFNDRYTYAALNASTCYCFDTKPYRRGRPEECDRPCYNNEGEVCGGDSAGSSRLTIYERDDTALIAILDGFSTGWNASDEIVESSPELCTQKCNENGNWLFAGLTTNGCFCSNNQPIAESKLDEERCMAQCPDHVDAACGGWSYATFYMSLCRQQFPREPPFPINATQNGQWYYKGCYLSEEFRRIAPATKDLKNEASAEACIRFCDEEDNYDLAGLLGADCYCYNQAEFSHREFMVSGQYCGNVCAKYPSEPCGGRDERTTKRDEGDFTITLYGRSFDHAADEGYELIPLLIPGAVPWTREGCFRDPNALSNAPYKVQNTSMDPEQCITICKEDNNRLFAMPYNDGTCYCSVDLPNEELELHVDDNAYGADNECNRPCVGHPNQYCGGPGEDDVPRVRFWRNPSDSARTELLVSPLLSFVWSVLRKSGSPKDEA